MFFSRIRWLMFQYSLPDIYRQKCEVRQGKYVNILLFFLPIFANNDLQK
jgi:hypothetical protein